MIYRSPFWCPSSKVNQGCLFYSFRFAGVPETAEDGLSVPAVQATLPPSPDLYQGVQDEMWRGVPVGGPLWSRLPPAVFRPSGLLPSVLPGERLLPRLHLALCAQVRGCVRPSMRGPMRSRRQGAADVCTQVRGPVLPSVCPTLPIGLCAMLSMLKESPMLRTDSPHVRIQFSEPRNALWSRVAFIYPPPPALVCLVSLDLGFRIISLRGSGILGPFILCLICLISIAFLLESQIH